MPQNNSIFDEFLKKQRKAKQIQKSSLYETFLKKQKEAEQSQCKSKSDLLEQANSVIRKANVRVHELKLKQQELEKVIDDLTKENKYLHEKTIKGYDGLSDMDILGYQSRPSNSELRKRYKQLATIYHPDKGGSRLMMQRINNSYESLKN